MRNPCLALMTCLMVTSPAIAGEEAYGPINFDGGKIACNDDRGPEIKKSQVFTAPSDRFYKEGSVSVRTISGWGSKGYSCSVAEVRKKNIKAKTDFGEIEFSVIYEFVAYAWADCGSGALYNSGGKTASVECEVSATMVKYTNK